MRSGSRALHGKPVPCADVIPLLGNRVRQALDWQPPIPLASAVQAVEATNAGLHD